jgi:kinesin family protein 1
MSKSNYLFKLLLGFNCCVFAFGQTGAGKSYTMMGDVKGDPNNYGLIPRICFGLFEALEDNNGSLLTGKGASEIVSFSHLEIYNENVKDLLAPPTSGYLKVREHPKTGVFVSNLTTVRVTNFEDVMSLIAIGDKNRFVASTQMNSHSSRSHAIVTLTVVRNSRNTPKHGLPTTALQQKIGRVHLVDLAGSERVTLSGAKGDRLKESNHINKSLSVLGDVIKCLGDSANKNHRGAVHVPYRNSTLTMVLKDSLGGNSHAIMVAAVSPGSFDYEETISTLKYADRAKRVRMRVDPNVTSGLNFNDNSALELVPILQAEVSKLKEMLKQQQIQQTKLQNISLESSASEVLQGMRERVLELENQLAEREKWIASATEKENNRFPIESFNDDVNDNDNDRSYSQLRLSLTDNITANSSFSEPNIRSKPVVVLSEDAVDISLPRVINLNQDPLFSECLVYYVPEGKVLAGAKESQADILLSGPDIIAEHAILHHDSDNGHVLLEVLGGALVFVNGEIVDSISNINYNNNNGTQSFGPLKQLKHYDRIAFGRFHLFRYEAKGQSNRRGLSPLLIEDGDALTTSDSINSSSNNNHLEPPGWEYAQEELMRKNEGVNGMLRSPTELFSLGNGITSGHISDTKLVMPTPVVNESPPSKSFLSSIMLPRFSPKKEKVESPQLKVEKQLKSEDNIPIQSNTPSTPPVLTKSPYRVNSPSLVPKISFTPPRNNHPSSTSINDLPSLEKLPFNNDENDAQRGPPSPPPPGPPPLHPALSPTIPTSLSSTLIDSMDNIDKNIKNENQSTPPTGNIFLSIINYKYLLI